MSEPLLVASGLSLLAAAIHGILGETAIFHQARANPLPPFRLPRALRFLTIGTPAENSALHWAYLRASWHFLTLDFIVSTILFGMAASSTSPTLENVVRVTAVRYIAYAAAWLLIVAVRHRSVVGAPQWLLVLAIAGCALLG